MFKKAIYSIIQDLKLHYWRDSFVNLIGGGVLTPRIIRYIIYTLYGMKLKSLDIRPGCYFKRSKIEVGENTFINNNCFFENLGLVKIGNDCAIGPEVMFSSTTHDIGSSARRATNVHSERIEIKDGCWIGARTTVLAGVTINEGVVVAANSLINKDCESNFLYAGIPARKIREL